MQPTPIVIFEGLHPMHDDRVNEALDLTIYLDITVREPPQTLSQTPTRRVSAQPAWAIPPLP